jgi:hypothetical protein
MSSNHLCSQLLSRSLIVLHKSHDICILYTDYKEQQWRQRDSAVYLLYIRSFKRQQVHSANCNKEVPHVLEVLDGRLRGPIECLNCDDGVLHHLATQERRQ